MNDKKGIYDEVKTLKDSDSDESENNIKIEKLKDKIQSDTDSVNVKSVTGPVKIKAAEIKDNELIVKLKELFDAVEYKIN